jgi:hypothetical protein
MCQNQVILDCLIIRAPEEVVAVYSETSADRIGPVGAGLYGPAVGALLHHKLVAVQDSRRRVWICADEPLSGWLS